MEIVRDRIVKSITENLPILIDDSVYDYLGYTSKAYFKKKFSFTKLIMKNKIDYDLICDERDVRKKYYVLSGKDLGYLLTQMRTKNVAELREYIASENKILRESVNELKQLMVDESKRAEQRYQSIQQQMRRNVDILSNVIAPKMSPDPINEKKTRCIGLYKTPVRGEWYVMRRQQDEWQTAERQLIEQRQMVLVQKWTNVSHAVDIVNDLKQHYRDQNWTASGNYIRCENLSDDNVAKLVSEIITKENDATLLARDNKEFL